LDVVNTARQMIRAFLFLLALFSSACASHKLTIAEQQKAWDDSAHVLDVSAADWRRSGPPKIADYYQDEADRARHNRDALGCGFFDAIVDILLKSDDCDMN